MRLTIDIDDGLIETACWLTGTAETSALVRLALETLVRVEAERHLADLGGTMEDAAAAPRRRTAKAR